MSDENKDKEAEEEKPVKKFLCKYCERTDGTYFYLSNRNVCKRCLKLKGKIERKTADLDDEYVKKIIKYEKGHGGKKNSKKKRAKSSDDEEEETKEESEIEILKKSMKTLEARMKKIEAENKRISNELRDAIAQEATFTARKKGSIFPPSYEGKGSVKSPPIQKSKTPIKKREFSSSEDEGESEKKEKSNEKSIPLKSKSRIIVKKEKKAIVKEEDEEWGETDAEIEKTIIKKVKGYMKKGIKGAANLFREFEKEDPPAPLISRIKTEYNKEWFRRLLVRNKIPTTPK